MDIENGATIFIAGPTTSFYEDDITANAIENSGNLFVNIKDGDIIFGNILHQRGAVTALNFYGPEDNDDNITTTFFRGNVIGSDENFIMNINKGAIWMPCGQEEEVYGVNLDDGWISLNDGNVISGATTEFKNNFEKLRLRNFNATEGSLLSLSTDLINDMGDKYEFIGTTPDTTLSLMIINKDDNNGTPISPSDGHKVTVVSAPSDTKMQFESYLGFYNTDNTLYSPIVYEEIAGSTKNWNFVGWQSMDQKRGLEEQTLQTGLDPYLNTIELDQTFKRLNDLRTDPSEVGVWIRGEKGETKIRNYKYDFNLMSGGYDCHNENDARLLFGGFGITYSKNDCNDKVIGDAKSLGYNLYGSWLGKKNHDYVDVILKYGKLDKNYAGYDNNKVFVSGDYDKNLLSLAAKYGRRYFMDNGIYYEPHVGLTYGRIGSVDFVDNQKTKIHADATNSIITSLGMQVGKNVKGTEYYGKATFYHDFDGRIEVSAPNVTAHDDMGGSWLRLAVVTSRKVDKNNSFYFDLEKDFGNKVKKPYSFSAGYRYTW